MNDEGNKKVSVYGNRPISNRIGYIVKTFHKEELKNEVERVLSLSSTERLWTFIHRVMGLTWSFS